LRVFLVLDLSKFSSGDWTLFKLFFVHLVSTPSNYLANGNISFKNRSYNYFICKRDLPAETDNRWNLIENLETFMVWNGTTDMILELTIYSHSSEGTSSYLLNLNWVARLQKSNLDWFASIKLFFQTSFAQIFFQVLVFFSSLVSWYWISVFVWSWQKIISDVFDVCKYIMGI